MQCGGGCLREAARCCKALLAGGYQGGHSAELMKSMQNVIPEISGELKPGFLRHT